MLNNFYFCDNLTRTQLKYHKRFQRLQHICNILNANILALLFLVITFECRMTGSSLISPGVYMVRSPESIVAPIGDEVLFECELNLEFERLEWRFRHINWKSNEFHNLNKNDSYNISDEDKISRLRIYVSSSTIGDYQCIAWFGSVAIASVTATLTLATISLDDESRDRFAPKTVTWTVAPMNSVLIKCGSVISNPEPVWNFYKDDISVSQSLPQLSTGALVLNSVMPNSSGIYSCSAINAITGTEVDLPQKIHLNVQHTPRTEPHFLMQPLKKFVARPGHTIVLECPGVGNPPPKAIWSSPDVDISQNDRVTTLDYGLQILEVTSQDRGNYTCRLDNGLSKVLVHSIQLEVLEPPEIIKGPRPILMNESEYVEMECIAQGSPPPDIFWMINGKDTRWDDLIRHKGGKLIISRLEKRHAGIVQCFAKNEAGETYESSLLQVKPKQIGMQPYGVFPTKSTYDHVGKQNKSRKKHKIANMIPPSRPNVTRLSDDSVMIRWYVPKNDGLPIQFFKVQYRMLGDPSRKIPRENWQTTNEDIPYGKRDKNGDGFKNFTSAVTGLKPDRYYRFRIIAVYSNNDNKEGNSSGKFLLQRASQLGLSRSHLPAPVLTRVEGVSETEIVLHWTLPVDRSNPVDGFYAYYRPASTAGEYLKATIEGMHIRRFKIDMLEPGTAYEFKLQSFTSSTASDFSSIVTGRTLKPPTTPPPLIPSVIPASEASKGSNSMFPAIAGGAGGCILLLVVAVLLCFILRRRKNLQQGDEDKPQIDQIQMNSSHFGPPPVMGGQHHRTNHRMNGTMTRMNITPNPLAQEGDNNRNMMELRFLSSTTAPVTTEMTTTGGLNHVNSSSHHQIGLPSATTMSSTTVMGSGMKSSQSSIASSGTLPHQSSSYHHPAPSPIMVHKLSPSSSQHQHHHHYQQQQNNNNHSLHHFQTPPPPLTPVMDQQRRTIDRSTRNLPYAVTGLDQADGIPPPTTRIPSLRRTRRPSGGSNGNITGSGGIGVPGSPRVQRSPMPGRAAAVIKSRNRLGSHTENMSSGSLNSIEV